MSDLPQFRPAAQHPVPRGGAELRAEFSRLALGLTLDTGAVFTILLFDRLDDAGRRLMVQALRDVLEGRVVEPPSSD
jgi:hypothetical protein